MQVQAAELTRLNCATHPSSVTRSDLLQSTLVSEQQEMPRILWMVVPSLWGAVIEVERAVLGGFQVDLGHDLPVFRAHVPDMIRALLEHAAVLPRSAQAFGVPVVHPAPGAARSLRRACRKQYQRNGEKSDRRDYRADGARFGHSGAPFDPGSASREDALPIQMGRPAAATRRIFQWADRKFLSACTVGSIVGRPDRSSFGVRAMTMRFKTAWPIALYPCSGRRKGWGALEAPSRDTTIDGGRRRIHAR